MTDYERGYIDGLYENFDDLLSAIVQCDESELSQSALDVRKRAIGIIKAWAKRREE